MNRELIIDHLDDSDEVFFLLTGNARVTIRSEDGRAVSFRELGPGATFGEYAAIDGRSRSASVEARSACLVASIAAGTFRNLVLAEPTVAWSLLNYFVLEEEFVNSPPASTNSARWRFAIAYRPRSCGSPTYPLGRGRPPA